MTVYVSIIFVVQMSDQIANPYSTVAYVKEHNDVLFPINVSKFKRYDERNRSGTIILIAKFPR
jgi:hypothetical protein